MSDIQVSVISLIIGVLITHIYHKYDKRKSKHEKAVEIAKEFEIILSSSEFRIETILSQVHKELDIMRDLKFLESKDYINSLEFDNKELIHKISGEKKQEYFDFQKANNTKFVKILSGYNESKEKERILSNIINDFDDDLSIAINIKNFSDKLKESNETTSDDGDTEFYSYKVKEDLKSYIISLVNDYHKQKISILNKLEWMSMYFVTGLADSDFVYQSLHQAYFAIVHVYYIEISSINDREAYDKYYTNLTSLYKHWMTKYVKRKSLHDKRIKKLSKPKGKV